MRVLLISTYDMGRQPFGLASPAAGSGSRGAEVDVRRSDARQADRRRRSAAPTVVGFFLPMHTATRLALPVIDRVRALNPAARLCAYGLYAPLNEALLRERGVDDVLGGEFEEDLVQRACALRRGARAVARRALPQRFLGFTFRVPERDGLPPLTRYATLQLDGERRTVGYTEASRGCKHRCRHCPIVPVYDGRFRVVPADVVLADVARAGRRRRAAHHLRRSRLLQRHPPRRCRSSRRCARDSPA